MCSHHWTHHSPGSLLCQSVRMRIVFCLFAINLVLFVPYIVLPRCLVNLMFCLCFPCVSHHIWSVFIFPESSSLVLQTDFIHPARGNLVLVVTLCTILTVRLLGLHLGPNPFFAVDCLHLDPVHFLCMSSQWAVTIRTHSGGLALWASSGQHLYLSLAPAG